MDIYEPSATQKLGEKLDLLLLSIRHMPVVLLTVNLIVKFNSN